MNNSGQPTGGADSVMDFEGGMTVGVEWRSAEGLPTPDTPVGYPDRGGGRRVDDWPTGTPRRGSQR